jgi:hypothetical protein
MNNDVAFVRIFDEVFGEYAALMESDASNITLEGQHFIIDVEAQLRRLYGNGQEFAYVRQLLLDDDHQVLQATRRALGQQFLEIGLWPVKSYFAHGE